MLNRLNNENRIEAAIIITYYGEKDTINDAVRSALTQKIREKYEIIVVDDGSEEAAIDTIENELQKDHKLKIVRQSNKGLAAARDTGVRLARGEWISFLDADDMINPNKLSKQIELVKAIDNTNIAVFTGTEIQPGNRFKWCFNSGSMIRNISKDVLYGKQPSGASLMISKETYIKSGGFIPEMRRHCEMYLIGKLISMGTIFYLVPEPLYIQYMRKESSRWSISYRYESIKNCIQILKDAFHKEDMDNKLATYFKRRMFTTIKVGAERYHYKFIFRLILLGWKEKIYNLLESLMLILFLGISVITIGKAGRIIQNIYHIKMSKYR